MNPEEFSALRRIAPANGSNGMGRTLPHSIEAEESLLSCCLMDGVDVVGRCVEKGLTPDSFYDTRHGILYGQIVDLHQRHVPIELSVIAEEMKTARRLDEVGGYPFLTQISGRVPTTMQAAYFIEKVSEQAKLREIIRTATTAIEDCYQFSGDLDGLTADFRRRLDFTLKDSGGRNGKSHGFTLWTPAQFLAYQHDPSACLLGDGFLEAGEWTSVVGIGGLGKTRITLWLAVCQITGRRWCDLPTAGKPQLWYFFSTENGVRRWQSDLSKILATLNDTDRALVESHLRIMALTADDDGDLCLGNPESRARLAATLRALPPGVCVFDPLADMVDGDESKTPDMVQTLRHLRTIIHAACPNAAVLLIHHARTGAANVAQAGDLFNAGNFGRGSKALYSRVRCELQLAPADKDDPNRLVLACGKANNCEKFAPRGILFDPETFTYAVDGSFDLDAWRNNVAGKSKEVTVSIFEVAQTVAERMKFSGDEVSTKDIVTAFESSGVSDRTIQRTIKSAIESGYLRKGKQRWMVKLGAKPLPKS